MIYHLYFSLIMAGYCGISILMGLYMMHYAGAREIDLGFVFMIQPITIFLRPFICAQADRYQSHQQLMSFFAMLSSLSYVPFITLPFFHERMKAYEEERPEMAQLKFYSLVVFHTLGSIGFCGVRSLGDSLAVNYAKRIGSNFARYRKYGSISYGLCGFGLGLINKDWILPNFVPALIMYSLAMLVLSVLVYAWPNQYFIMCSKNYEDPSIVAEYIESLPNASETVGHICKKLSNTLFCRCADNQKLKYNKPSGKWAENLTLSASGQHHSMNGNKSAESNGAIMPANSSQELLANRKHLTISQQLRIFALLIKRDFRVLLYLITIFYGGLVGYSGQNFVFTYIDVVCNRVGTCRGAKLTGIVIISYCTVETLCYMLIDKFRGRVNRLVMIEITFFSLIIHYYFYGFALEHLSPYFFLVESLHGVEYSISLSTCVELGYYFAREVELLLPELLQRGIISHSDNQELVKVSLLATMSGCYTLVYDGFGCILGSIVFGIITGNHSFVVTWIVIGSLATIGFVGILLAVLMGKCFGIRPTILMIRDRAVQEQQQQQLQNQEKSQAQVS